MYMDGFKAIRIMLLEGNLPNYSRKLHMQAVMCTSTLTYATVTVFSGIRIA